MSASGALPGAASIGKHVHYVDGLAGILGRCIGAWRRDPGCGRTADDPADQRNHRLFGWRKVGAAYLHATVRPEEVGLRWVNSSGLAGRRHGDVAKNEESRNAPRLHAMHPGLLFVACASWTCRKRPESRSGGS